MPVLWNGSPVGLTAYSLSLYPPPAPDTHTLCVRYHSSSLWFLVLSSGCFWTPHPWPSSLYKRNLLLLLCASQKSSVDRKELKGGPGQWGGVLEHPRVTNRRLAKNIWELFQSYWSIFPYKKYIVYFWLLSRFLIFSLVFKSLIIMYLAMDLNVFGFPSCVFIFPSCVFILVFQVACLFFRVSRTYSGIILREWPFLLKISQWIYLVFISLEQLLIFSTHA